MFKVGSITCTTYVLRFLSHLLTQSHIASYPIASSASSERVFSTAKNITDKKRSILLEIALFFQTLYFVVCFIMCVCMYVLSLLHLHCLSWIYIISIVDRGPTVGPTDGHGPGLFDLCTVAVRSRSGYLGLTAVHGPLKSSGPRQHCD